MPKELAFVLINPYTIAKSRTGGIIGRYISRTGLTLVAARMFAPCASLAKTYANLIRSDPEVSPNVRPLLADYIASRYAPDPTTGAPRRVMLLLFEGKNAIQLIKNVTGSIRPENNGETIRDTYGDCILDPTGAVQYFEPAVFIAPGPQSAAATLRLWAAHTLECGGMTDAAADVVQDSTAQKALVILKPDNFRFPSARPGMIIDAFSRSGLRIVCAKIHRMSVAQAENFYGPVQHALREKLKGKVAERAAKALAAEFHLTIPEALKGQLGDLLAPLYGDDQFYQIIHFMTGRWGMGLQPEEKNRPGDNQSLLLVYDGPNAISRIRTILGPTDPSKAQAGSVRREFGQDIMVNAAHASDSPENAAREMRITRVEEDTIQAWIDAYYPA